MKRYAGLLALGFSLVAAAELAAVQKPPLRIITSVFPLYEFARSVAGERGEVSLLLPPGAGVHTWQPRPSDVLRLSSADLFIYIGAGLEPWIPGLLRSVSSRRIKVLSVADFLTLESPDKEQEDHGGLDPHVWLDLGLDQQIIDRVSAILSGLDPAHASGFEARAREYSEKLRILDEKFAASLGRCSNKTLLVGGHAAFGYLANRYGLQQVSVYGLSPDAEPTPGRFLSLVRWARENRLKAVFQEANTNPKLARLLAKEIPAELVPLHPGANLSQGERKAGRTFIELMEENLQNIKRGLGCD